jgi:hypothetical protein
MDKTQAYTELENPFRYEGALYHTKKENAVMDRIIVLLWNALWFEGLHIHAARETVPALYKKLWPGTAREHKESVATALALLEIKL